jgi:hypothetical protein
MFTLYVFAVVVGGGLLAFSFLGGADGDAHHDVDHGHPAVQWLSLRTATYFLFVFGGVGAVLSKTWPAGTAPIVLLLAAVAGLGVGALVSAAFAWLRRTDSGDRAHDEEFVGLTGRVVLPIRSGGVGKVQVQRGGRTIELLARAVRADVAESALWTSVIVVDMDKGTALVTPLEDPAYRSISAISNTE